MSGERAILEARAAVYTYDSTNAQWTAADGGSSRVFIFHNPATSKYRVIGVNAQDENQFVLNAPIYASMVYQKTSNQFLQWRDTQAIYGLNFISEDDCTRFVTCLVDIIAKLQEPPTSLPPPPPPVFVSQEDTSNHQANGSGELTPRSASTAPSTAAARSRQHTTSAADGSGSAASTLAVEQPTRSRGNTGPPAPQLTSSAPTMSTTQPMGGAASKKADSLPSVGLLTTPTGPPKDSKKDMKREKSGFFSLRRKKERATIDWVTDGPASGGGVGGAMQLAGPTAPPGEVEALRDSPTHISRRDSTLLSERDLIIKELYTTEQTYQQSLDKLMQCAEAAKARAKELFSEEERKAIFGNIEVIHSFSRNLLASLDERLAAWGDASKIGDVFLRVMPFMRVYKTYCNNYETAIKTLEALSKERRAVAAYLKSCMDLTQGHQLSFLLIQPVQRIPRYVLLFKDLLKKTPHEHPDYADLVAACEQIGKLGESLNNSVREEEKRRQFSELLQQKFGKAFDAVLAPHRTLVKEGSVEAKQLSSLDKRYCYLMLCNDVVVLAGYHDGKEGKRVKRYKVEEVLPLEVVWVDLLTTATGTERVFQFVTPALNVLVTVGSPADKQAWADALLAAINDHLERKGMLNEARSHRVLKFTFPDGAVYSGEWSLTDGKPDGKGIFRFANKNVYEGEFRDGLMDGQGKLTYTTTGEVYEGQWAKDKPHGHGVLHTALGTYTGEWCEGFRHGKGELRWANGDYYVGQWERNKMSGTGTLVCLDGHRYDGEWKDNMKHGKGTWAAPIGVYSGDFVCDRREGEGTMKYSDGQTYTGQWKDDKRHGRGVWTSADGATVYDGEWSDDMREGKGTLTKPGWKYEGEWRANRRHGKGRLETDQEIYEGEWANDSKEGTGTWQRKGTTESYEGGWHLDMRFGRGTYIGPDGSRYDGEWVKDRKEGKGTLTYANGAKYSGHWQADKRHGQGVYMAPGEISKYVGDWREDRREGKGQFFDKTGVFDGEWKEDKRHGPGQFKAATTGIIFQGEWENDLKVGTGQLYMGDGSEHIQHFREGHLLNNVRDYPPELPFPKVSMKK